MKRRWLSLVGVFVVVGLLAGSWYDLQAAGKEAEIIGSAKCKKCHKGAKKGTQFEIWQESTHAKAYLALASEAALAIAKEKGIENPQEEAECLGCHTTAGALPGVATDVKYKASEGVGCEACHGAGSLYKKKKVMEDRDKAVAAGLIIADQETCVQCHNDKCSMYKEFDFEARWEKIAHPTPTTE
jgi:excinuclease UvrABC ATPase subunit